MSPGSSQFRPENYDLLAIPSPPHEMTIIDDDPSAVEPARRRLSPKTRFRIFSSLSKLSSCYKSDRFKSKSKSASPEYDVTRLNHLECQLPPLEQTTDNTITIFFDNSSVLTTPVNKDEYNWAIVYENQRGLTVFSSPFYSQLSLLPIDPPQFTVSSKSLRESRKLNVSLCNYPLPDGTWHWVSNSWMVDMRSGSGEVQHDGFEYNWFFREKHWHAEIGKLSTGAWVRRRRWVRLMMRPAHHTVDHSEGSASSSAGKSRLFDQPVNASHPSLVHHPSDIALIPEAELEWEGNEQDWARYRCLIRKLGRDGRKLELWRMWLHPYLSNTDLGKGKRPQYDLYASLSLTKNGTGTPNSPSLKHLGTLLENHGDAVLLSFVYPDSRAQFIDLIRRVGLAPELGRCLGHNFSSTYVDFWSYLKGLKENLDGGNEQRRIENMST